MSVGIPPVALLCVALGLLLAFLHRSTFLTSLAAFAAGAITTASFLSVDSGWLPNPVIGCSITAGLTALCVHLPRNATAAAALPLSGISGVWFGLLAEQMATSQALGPLLLIALALPGEWLVARGWAIVLKILSGWLMAIAILAAALPMITTPGYVPDHME